MNPARMDKEEHDRVMAMRKAAANRPHLKETKARRGSVTFTLPRHITGYSNAAARGDSLRRQILKREYAMAMTPECVAHVRDGKPLTEHGAKLLGVPWEVS